MRYLLRNFPLKPALILFSLQARKQTSSHLPLGNQSRSMYHVTWNPCFIPSHSASPGAMLPNSASIHRKLQGTTCVFQSVVGGWWLIVFSEVFVGVDLSWSVIFLFLFSRSKGVGRQSARSR